MAAQPTSLADALRPAVEAQDDLDWYVNEAPAEMGQGSTFGAMLERASLEHEWCPPDLRDQEEKRRGLSDGTGHHGESFAAQPWQEWVPDPHIRRTKNSPPRVIDGGYFRTVWGERPKQDSSPQVASARAGNAVGAQMYRHVSEVLALVPTRLRDVLMAQHEPRVHGEKMKRVFGSYVRVATQSESARTAYREAKTKGHAESSLYAWLEGLALRSAEGKGKAGEKKVIDDAKRDCARDLKAAYAAYELARSRLPDDWRYPYQSAVRRARHLSLVGQ